LEEERIRTPGGLEILTLILENNHIPIMLVVPWILSPPQRYRNCDVLDFQKLGSLEQRTTKVPPSL
jgi:hypothetical protein